MDWLLDLSLLISLCVISDSMLTGYQSQIAVGSGSQSRGRLGTRGVPQGLPPCWEQKGVWVDSWELSTGVALPVSNDNTAASSCTWSISWDSVGVCSASAGDRGSPGHRGRLSTKTSTSASCALLPNVLATAGAGCECGGKKENGHEWSQRCWYWVGKLHGGWNSLWTELWRPGKTDGRFQSF